MPIEEYTMKKILSISLIACLASVGWTKEKDFKSIFNGKNLEGWEGHFGCAGHSDPVSFRNIRIKRLSNETH